MKHMIIPARIKARKLAPMYLAPGASYGLFGSVGTLGSALTKYKIGQWHESKIRDVPFNENSSELRLVNSVFISFEIEII